MARRTDHLITIGGVLAALVAFAVYYLATDGRDANRAELRIVQAEQRAELAEARQRVAEAEAQAARAQGAEREAREVAAEQSALAVEARRASERLQTGGGHDEPAAGRAGIGHDRLVAAYLERQSTNDIPWILELYAPEVRYYDKGWVTQRAIYDDKSTYFRRWPDRTNRLDAPVQTAVGPDGVETLRFDYAYTVAASGRRRGGRAWAELDVEPGAAGYRIRGERGGVYRR